MQRPLAARRRGPSLKAIPALGMLSALLQLALVSAAQDALADCQVEHIPKAKHGETVTVALHVTSDGSSCTLTPRVGAGQAQSISVIERPRNGSLKIARPSAVYTPKRGFAGTDTFLLGWFGTGFGPNSRAVNFRTRVQVRIEAAK